MTQPWQPGTLPSDPFESVRVQPVDELAGFPVAVRFGAGPLLMPPEMYARFAAASEAELQVLMAETKLLQLAPVRKADTFLKYPMLPRGVLKYADQPPLLMPDEIQQMVDAITRLLDKGAADVGGAEGRPDAIREDL